MDYPGRVSDESLWIFGYGSLVWRPAFSHRRRAPARIHGWARRFWQGSTDHRGIPSRPGRVVTLVAADDPAILAERAPAPPRLTCWGCAYEVAPEDREVVLEELDHRERGGYDRIEIEMTIRIAAEGEVSIPGLMYVANENNPNYLGPAPIENIARQILTATGPSGPNPEYVFELARSLRLMGGQDSHIDAVESALVRLAPDRAS
jgi:cation transport regulator ChaC